MTVLVVTARLYAPWAQSLKDKRSEVKSLTARLKNKFNLSVAETAEQDTVKTIVITMAAVAHDAAQADSMADNILNYIEGSTQAEVVSFERELYR